LTTEKVALLWKTLSDLVSYTEACEGMLNATNAGQVVKAKEVLEQTKLGYACHIDLEPGQEPDDCVLDGGVWDHCYYAARYGEEARKHCGEWKPVLLIK
jgi:hypothetical protein